MGSPLDSMLVKNFMISLEVALPTIKKHVAHSKQYADDINADIDSSKIKYGLEKLNGHHPNIQFTYETEEN